MSTIIHETNTQGIHCIWRQDEHTLRVWSTLADMDCDADGANGQHGQRPAYHAKPGMGSEALANGGMKRLPDGKIVWAADWGKDIAIVGPDREPLVLADGTIPSKTAWKDPAKHADDPTAYVDAETIPYLVIPGPVRLKAKGTVLGCHGRITNSLGRSFEAGVLDVGPRSKSGEASIEAVRQAGGNPNPQTGGIETASITYELFPNEPFTFNGFTYALIRA